VTNLARVAAAYTGTVYLIDKQTGAIRELPHVQYADALRSSELGGFDVRLTAADALVAQVRILQMAVTRN